MAKMTPSERDEAMNGLIEATQATIANTVDGLQTEADVSLDEAMAVMEDGLRNYRKEDDDD